LARFAQSRATAKATATHTQTPAVALQNERRAEPETGALMKATFILKNHHQELSSIFEQIQSAEGDEARALVEEIASFLVAHTTIEKEILYPAAGEALGITGTIHEALEEHALVDFALQKLLSTRPDDETFHARVSVLRDLFQHHVQAEEEEVLAEAERRMSAERLEELGQRMEDLFEEVRGEDPRAVLAKELGMGMPRTTRRRAPAKKAGRRAAAKPKRVPAKRAAKAGRPAAKPGRPAAKPGRPAAKPGRAPGKRGAAPTAKKPAAKGRGEQRGEGARGVQARGKVTRGTRKRNGQKGGRASSASR
jgi:hypothetical protein